MQTGLGSLWIWLGCSCFVPLAAQSRTDRPLCDEILTTLIPQRVFRTPAARLPRVEIRSCMPGLTENLQLVAWEADARKPSFSVTTSDETIVQLAMAGAVSVVETTGGAHDIIFVIVYEGSASLLSSKPRLALQAVTKSEVTITSNHQKFSIDYLNLRGNDNTSSIPHG